MTQTETIKFLKDRLRKFAELSYTTKNEIDFSALVHKEANYIASKLWKTPAQGIKEAENNYG